VLEAADKELAAAQVAHQVAQASAQAALQAASTDPSSFASSTSSLLPSDLTLSPPSLTVAQLQEALSTRGLDTKWDPLKGKKQLVDRLQVGGWGRG
jgi:hypothetical protein